MHMRKRSLPLLYDSIKFWIYHTILDINAQEKAFDKSCARAFGGMGVENLRFCARAAGKSGGKHEKK